VLLGPAGGGRALLAGGAQGGVVVVEAEVDHATPALLVEVVPGE
jgi:hypothetical protein